MDINSLLSPQDSPAPETPPPARASPSKRPPLRHQPSRTPSGLSHQLSSSPQPPQPPQPSSSGYHYGAPSSHAQTAHPQHAGPAALHSPSMAAYTNGRVHSAASTPPVDARPQLASPRDPRNTPPNPLHRQVSTPGMDALADLASMQHVQHSARQQSAGQRPSITMQNIPRSISGGSDFSFREPSPQPARNFYSGALDEASLDTLNQLEKALKDNPFDYYSRVSFITILRQGLQTVLQAGDATSGAALPYNLLPVLREAYEAMNRKYGLGEQLWTSRINDEKALARSVEERMAVLELCLEAVREEPYSTSLWSLYGEYASHLFACAWGPNAPETWPEEDQMIGRELFTTELLVDTWQRAADSVKHNINDSSRVWDRYLQVLQEDLDRRFSREKAGRVAGFFTERLKQPHATWDSTLSNFSTFNSRYNPDNYEAIMEHAVKQNAHIKKTYALREEFEFRLSRAMQDGDQNAEYYAFTRYLKWEKKTIGVSSFRLVNAVFERAHVRFPVDPGLWEDHAEFLIWQNNSSVSLLDVLERATRHCPWSGSLWSHRILTLEAEHRGFREIEAVKHGATGSGMLEHTDLEELIKVQIAWCGYLRRKAFDASKATEDDVDIAEVGIRSALELARELGIKKYGKHWPGDAKYRLERIHIKFWTQRGNMNEARRIWEELVKSHADSYDFWYRYYIWEMVVWSHQAVRDESNAGHELRTPSSATSVLEKGMKRLTTLDHPEPLAEMYMNHCEQHESVLKVRSALVERRRTDRIIAVRRQKEAETAQQQSNDVAEGPSKRKLDDVMDTPESAAKRARQAEAEDSPAVAPSVEAPATQASEVPATQPTAQKRDREHASIIVEKLPSDVTQTHVRQFFTDAGNVRNVMLKPELDTVTATVEFETSDEAEYALLKQAKGFHGHDITIKRGESTTLYVSNYPEHADDAYLRKLFSPFGEILDMRFPSLKYATHRRFCYIQFSNPEEAIAATKLDGQDVEGHQMQAKISDPNAKKKRNGASEEGREIYVRHLSFNIKQPAVKEVFSKFGRIEKVNMPTLPSGHNKGNNKGFCFIAFTKKEDAEAAVAEMNGKKMWDYDLLVEIAKPKGEVNPKIKSERHNTGTPTPENSNALPVDGEEKPAFSGPTASPQERSFALLDLPDTVNDARIAALVEPYNYKKITLMPQHGGAIVEFTEVENVGKAMLALEGYEVAPGRKIRTGTVKELKKMKGEYKPSNSFIQPTRVNRPVARGGTTLRGRGKPGLGFAPRTTVQNGEKEKKEVKSNADFRAMLLGGKNKDNDGDNDKEMRDQA
jgi:RNA recognition motif-containing protein